MTAGMVLASTAGGWAVFSVIMVSALLALWIATCALEDD